MTLACVRTFLRYSDWANSAVLDAAQALDDEHLDQRFDMSRGSLRRILLHIWGGESVWLARWRGEAETPWIDETEAIDMAELLERFGQTGAARRVPRGARRSRPGASSGLPRLEGRAVRGDAGRHAPAGMYSQHAPPRPGREPDPAPRRRRARTGLHDLDSPTRGLTGPGTGAGARTHIERQRQTVQYRSLRRRRASHCAPAHWLAPGTWTDHEDDRRKCEGPSLEFLVPLTILFAAR